MKALTFAVVFLLLLSPLAVHAQQAAIAVLSGQVVDASGAVVPNAQVTLRHTATNASRTANTSDAGLYVFSDLAPGEYEVTVRSTGFTDIRTTLRLPVGQKIHLKHTLQVSAQTQTVILDDTENRLLVNTTSAAVDGVVTARSIDTLPLNGRNYIELALLVPGNAPAPNFDPTKTNTLVISSVGQIGRGGNVTVDGADNNDDVVGGQLHNLPQDAVQEFQIATNQFSAELGRSGSSLINIVTKAGTNDWHGSLSAFFRDDAIQALPATFDRSLGFEPSFDRQQWAGSLGGPLVQDKAWWFAALEYRNQDGAVLVGQRDSATQSILRTLTSAPLDDLIFTTRGDWRPSERDSLTFRYSLQREEAVGSSTLDRSIGSASQRQSLDNDFQAFVATWSRTFTPRLVNRASFSVNNFINRTDPVQPGPQLTFPSIQDGASFRVPQQTRQNRLQFSDTVSWYAGRHYLSFGGDVHRIDADFDLRVFQQGRIELVEDFPSLDRDQNGVLDDNDLLFAVTLRSATPTLPLIIPENDNTHFALFVQDDWRVHPQFSLSLGLRYQLDTEEKNVSRVAELNPIILPFLNGSRQRDKNNFAPRIGLNWATPGGRFSAHAGYGIFYDRITLEIQSLERGLDGRALAVEVRAGNVQFLDPMTGFFVPGAPTLANPFTGFVFPGAGAGGINIIDNRMQNPTVQHFNLGLQWEFARDFVLRADGVHNLGTHFIIGRPIGTVFNPVVGGPDVVKNLESSVNTVYDALLLNVQKRFSGRYQFQASYTLSKFFNYANDDQIPFSNGPIDPNNLRLEYGPAPNDQRHRFVFSGSAELPYGMHFSSIWTMASGVPMDILLPNGSSRIPNLQRNAGGRVIQNAAALNAFIQQVNAGGGVGGMLLPSAPANAQFSDSLHSLDMRLSKAFGFGDGQRVEVMAEIFNLFNVTNVLGVSKSNYSGFGNVLGAADFGRPVTTAGGVFGSGGPRAFQFAARYSF
jgi:hypothetical protein